MSAIARLARIHDAIDRGEDIAPGDYLEASSAAELERRQNAAADRLASQRAADAEAQRRREATGAAREGLPPIIARLRSKLTEALRRVDSEIAAANSAGAPVDRVLNRNALRFLLDEAETIWLPALLAALNGTIPEKLDPVPPSPLAELGYCLHRIESEASTSWDGRIDIFSEITAARGLIEPLRGVVA